MKWSIQTPNAVGIAAARTWPASFGTGARPRKSSIAPTTQATAAPSRIPRISLERSRNARDGTRIPMKIASPPSRGIGRRLRRRSSGVSTTPRSRAMPPTAGVRRTTIRRAIAAPYRTSGLARSSSTSPTSCRRACRLRHRVPGRCSPSRSARGRSTRRRWRRPDGRGGSGRCPRAWRSARSAGSSWRPHAFTVATAAAVELPVAIIGSSRSTSRSAMSFGSLT